jgi:hypothetical protein
MEALLNGPAMKPPSGVLPNFENPPNQSVGGFVGGTIALGIAAILCCLQIFTRLTTTKRLLLEDCTSISPVWFSRGHD